MKSRLELVGLILLFSILTVVSYKMGRADRPVISYDMAYDMVQGKSGLTQEEDFSSEQKNMVNYVPAYSHVYIVEGKPLAMAITLSLRNIDENQGLKIQKVSYFNTEGDLIREYLKDGYKLKPLETKEIFIKRSDLDGGSGANFLVYYSMPTLARQPIIETIMSGELEEHSYIFTSRGENHNLID